MAKIRCDYKYFVYAYDYEQIFRAASQNPYEDKDIEITPENINDSIDYVLKTGLPLYGEDIRILGAKKH